MLKTILLFKLISILISFFVIFMDQAYAQSSGGLPPIANLKSKNTSNSTPEKELVNKAEQQENFKNCIDGRYPALCNHSLLSGNELEAVRKAEIRENNKTCSDGR